MEDSKAKCFHIRSSVAVRLFREYFDDLWENCEAVITKDEVRDRTIREIWSHVDQESTKVYQARLDKLCSKFEAEPNLAQEHVISAIKRFVGNDKLLDKYLLPPNGRLYWREKLYTGNNVEVMLMNWASNAECLPHDHGNAKGWVYVVEGSVKNTNFRSENIEDSIVLTETNTGDYHASEIIHFGHHEVHKMKNLGNCLVTLHIYVPLAQGRRVYEPTFCYKVPDDCGAWHATERTDECPCTIRYKGEQI